MFAYNRAPLKEGPPPGERLVTSVELASRLGIKRRTLSEWIREGVVPPPTRIRNRLYWRETDVQEFIQGQGG
jgi:predicted site-specific integrase-resolvase